MSSGAAKAMYPGLAKKSEAEPQALRRDKAGYTAGHALYGKPKVPKFSIPKAPNDIRELENSQ